MDGPSGNKDAVFIPSFANFDENRGEAAQTAIKVDELKEVAQAMQEESIATDFPTQNSDENDCPDISPIQEFAVKEQDHKNESLVKTSFVVIFSDLVSTKVRKSAAAAIIRGPPAARHFGGNRGGLPCVHKSFGQKPDGVGPVAGILLGKRIRLEPLVL